MAGIEKETGELPEEDIETAEALEKVAIAQSGENSPKPQTAQTYDVEEAAFWLHRHVPVGSVITYEHNEESSGVNGIVALLVKDFESLATGIWLMVKWLGVTVPELRDPLSTYFRKKRKVHICYPMAGNCPGFSKEMCTSPSSRGTLQDSSWLRG